MQKAAQAYFQTQVATTSQADLLLLLYEGAIKFLKMAKVKIDERDYAEKGILISKAMDVIAELDSSLNVQKGRRSCPESPSSLFLLQHAAA